jgi:hypothetical protein
MILQSFGINELWDILSIRTPKEILASRLTPEMESQLLFIMSHVKMGQQQRYQVMRVLRARHVKLFAFELATKFSRRGENPVQPRLCDAKIAIFKRLKTGVSLRSRSSPSQLKRYQL